MKKTVNRSNRSPHEKIERALARLQHEAEQAKIKAIEYMAGHGPILVKMGADPKAANKKSEKAVSLMKLASLLSGLHDHIEGFRDEQGGFSNPEKLYREWDEMIAACVRDERFEVAGILKKWRKLLA